MTKGGALFVFDWASGKQLVRVPKAHDDRADGVVHVAIAYQRIDRFRVAKNAFVPI